MKNWLGYFAHFSHIFTGDRDGVKTEIFGLNFRRQSPLRRHGFEIEQKYLNKRK